MDDITETITRHNDIIIHHSYEISDHDNYICVSYTYKDQQPIFANITFRGNLSMNTNMLRRLLLYAYCKVPYIHKFMVNDITHINYDGSGLINLAYLTIAYNSCTWYEKYFGAVMCDEQLFGRYKSKLGFLTDGKPDFTTFLQIAQPPLTQIEYLEDIYRHSRTYRDFFISLPLVILQPWLNTFMEYYLTDVFSKDWVIDINSPKFNTYDYEGGHSSKYRIIMHKDIHTV